MRRTRILHVIASSRGGGATHVRSLALGLDRSRFDVEVAMPEDGGQVGRTDFEGAGLAFHRLDIAARPSVASVSRLRRLASDAGILHVHGGRAAFVGRLAVAALGSVRPPTVYTLHGLAAPFYGPSRRLPMLAAERLLSRRTDAIIAVSEEERRSLLVLSIIPSERVHVVRNGVDIKSIRSAAPDRMPVRDALRLPTDAIAVTTVCRLYKPRDFETLLRAFRDVADEDDRVHLLIVGEGPHRPRVESLRGRMGLTPRVLLTGQRRDVPSILAASDIFTLTTWGWEGLPISVLEAMAAGLPVVATDAGGISEAVLKGETGLLVPRQDAGALALAFARLVADADLRARMGAAGRRRADALFSLQRMVEETAAVYDMVLSKAREAARGP